MLALKKHDTWYGWSYGLVVGQMVLHKTADCCSCNNSLNLCRIGYRWIRQFLALCCYTLLLMPGFIQGWRYGNFALFFSLAKSFEIIL